MHWDEPWGITNSTLRKAPLGWKAQRMGTGRTNWLLIKDKKMEPSLSACWSTKYIRGGLSRNQHMLVLFLCWMCQQGLGSLWGKNRVSIRFQGCHRSVTSDEACYSHSAMTHLFFHLRIPLVSSTCLLFLLFFFCSSCITKVPTPAMFLCWSFTKTRPSQQGFARYATKPHNALPWRKCHIYKYIISWRKCQVRLDLTERWVTSGRLV